MWLQGVGIDARVRHVFEAGSYSSTVPSDRCGWRGRITGALASGVGPAPPMTKNFPPTTAATPPPRAVGIGANVRHPSVAGLYSQASLIGFHPGAPDEGRSKPPNKYILPFRTVTAAWWTGCGIGFFCVHASLAGSYSYTRPAGLKPGSNP